MSSTVSLLFSHYDKPKQNELVISGFLEHIKLVFALPSRDKRLTPWFLWDEFIYESTDDETFVGDSLKLNWSLLLYC